MLAFHCFVLAKKIRLGQSIHARHSKCVTVQNIINKPLVTQLAARRLRAPLDNVDHSRLSFPHACAVDLSVYLFRTFGNPSVSLD